MRGKDLLFILNDMDDDLIAEAESAGRRGIRRNFARIAVAACLAVAVGVTAVAAGFGRAGSTPTEPKEKLAITSIPGAVLLEDPDAIPKENGVAAEICSAEDYVYIVKKSKNTYVYGTAENFTTVVFEDEYATWYITTFEIRVIENIRGDAGGDTVKCIFFEYESEDICVVACPPALTLKQIQKNPTALYSLSDEQECYSGYKTFGDGYNTFDYADYIVGSHDRSDGESFDYCGVTVPFDSIR